MHTYGSWVFFLCSPDCPKQPRISFPSYKFFYTTISCRIGYLLRSNHSIDWKNDIIVENFFYYSSFHQHFVIFFSLRLTIYDLSNDSIDWENDIIVEDFMNVNSHYLVKCASIFVKVNNIDGTPYVRKNELTCYVYCVLGNVH